MIALKADFLRGSYPPLITPFSRGEVDYEAFARLVDRQVGQRSHGIVVNGTTAEPTTLTIEERDRLVQVAVEAAARRIPVVAATGSQSYAESIELTTRAAKAGADAVLVVTPYFIRPPQRGLVEYYVQIARSVELPLLIYHIPGRAAVTVSAETVAQIIEQAPNLVGMKHAVAEMSLVSELLVRFGFDFRIFAGLEELSYPMLALGAAGLMNAVGNLAPRRVAELCEHCAAGRMSEARAAHYALFELNQAIFFETNPIPLKYMMKRLGLVANDEHRLPMLPATPDLVRRLDGVLQRASLL